jgi:hypothetical protein
MLIMVKEKLKKNFLYTDMVSEVQSSKATRYKVMIQYGQWIANCKKERVERICAASIYTLRVGAPVPNQLQTLEKLEADGFVGLYRLQKKESGTIQRDQNNYLHTSAFVPTPETLKNLLGSLALLRNR